MDWANAHRGNPALDVAMTWVIAATSGALIGRALLPSFLAHFDRAEVVRALPPAAELRISDPNVRDDERARVRRLLERQK